MFYISRALKSHTLIVSLTQFLAISCSHYDIMISQVISCKMFPKGLDIIKLTMNLKKIAGFNTVHVSASLLPSSVVNN